VRYLHVCVQVYVRDMMDEKCAVSQTIRESTVAPRTSSVVVRVVDDGDGGWRTCSLARADTTILLVLVPTVCFQTDVIKEGRCHDECRDPIHKQRR
jgi:hypothetical protein